MTRRGASSSEEAPRLLQRRQGCANSKLVVHFDTVQMGDGRVVQDFMVVSPHNPPESLLVGIAVLPIVNGKAGLLRVYRQPLSAALWEVTRGFIDAGETPQQAAVRELLEETGLVCSVESLVDLGLMAPDPGVLAARVRLYATVLEPTAVGQASDEFGHQRFAWFAPDEIEGLIRSDAFQDGCSLVTWYRGLASGLLGWS